MSFKIHKILVVVFAALVLTACSPRMVGTWTAQRFETTKPGQQGVTLNNIGTIQFNKDGTGKKNISYSALGITNNDQQTFKWKWVDDKYVTIEGDTSAFSKVWIIITNNRSFQKWKSTDGANNIQIIELKKLHPKKLPLTKYLQKQGLTEETGTEENNSTKVPNLTELNPTEKCNFNKGSIVQHLYEQTEYKIPCLRKYSSVTGNAKEHIHKSTS